MTIKQQGGVFGRNPTFNTITSDSDAVIGGDALVSGEAVITGDLTSTSGVLTLGGNEIGAIEITVADDSVGEITPPRLGGFLFITTGGNGTFPNDGRSGLIFYDVGGSLRAGLSGFDGTVENNLVVTTSDVNGTTGVDGNITVSTRTGLLKIENRAGSSQTFQITFL